MSTKQQIYKEMLEFGLVCLRNSQSLPLERRPDSDALFRLGDFLHNLPELIVETDFMTNDLYFLDVETKAYLDNSAATADLWYRFFYAKVIQLFSVMPDSMRSEVSWPGPPIK